MELYLQFGHGMKQMTLEFAKKWDGAKVILSPRDIDPTQLKNWSVEFKKNNVECLFDPQFYFPKTNHKKLSQYDYWDNSFCTKLGSANDYETSLIESILAYNDIIDSKEFIIPSVMKKYDDEWIKSFTREAEKLIKATRSLVKERSILLTLALPSVLLNNQVEEVIETLIDVFIKFDVDGFYIVAEPPEERYLVDSPLWLSNLMQICAALKLADKKVIVGYSNHQMLCLTTANVDAIASGTYLNVRRFTNKFEENNDIKRKTTWYYCPQALSEYKGTFLDIAFSNGIMDALKPESHLCKEYVDIIFSGVLPSSTSFNETLAFKHYIQALKVQVESCSRNSFDETIAANEILLEAAERRIELLEKNGVFAQARSFKEVVDVNRSALQRLQKTRGFALKYSWKV